MREITFSARSSELFRLGLCPGSHRMQKGLPDNATELTKKGTTLHWYDEHQELDRSFLSSHDRDLLRLAKTLDDMVIERVHKQFDLCDETFEESREVAGSFVSNGFELTGHPDRIRFYRSRHLTIVFEKKYGFLEQVPAELNKQLRSYAVIFADEHVVVAMLQPRRSYDERVTVALYTEDDIKAAREEIISILEAASKPDAPLNPSEEACRYCRAKMICPAYQKAMMLPAVLTPDNALSKRAREAYLEQRLAELSDVQLEKVKVACSLANMVRPLTDDEIRKRKAADPESMPNYTLSKPAVMRDIVDPQRAISLLEIGGVATRDAILSFCSIPLGKLEETYRAAHLGLTWQEAREKISKVLSSVIETTEQRPKVLRK